jgi:hypothetical protein
MEATATRPAPVPISMELRIERCFIVIPTFGEKERVGNLTHGCFRINCGKRCTRK